MLKFKKQPAYTLAEILITLGVIGVVATMTLPVIVKNYQKKTTAKRLMQIYSQISQAITLAKNELGTGLDYKSNEEIKGKYMADNYIIPYLKLSLPAKYLTLQNIGYNVDWRTKDGRTYKRKSEKMYCALLTNGIILGFGTEYFGETLDIFVDINGYKNPNITGQDIFLFQYITTKDKLVAYGQGLQRTSLINKCKSSSSSKIYDNLYCTALIILDGWKILDDYPW